MTLEDLQAEQRTAEAELSALNPRQREVLVLACKGLAAKEIGRALGLSQKAVSQHRWRLSKLLGMTALEAAVLATRARWV